MEDIKKFIRRMGSIGIELQCSSNYPWIYLDKIDGKVVKEKKFSAHGYCLGFMTDEKVFKETLSDTFNLIRSYR